MSRLSSAEEKYVEDGARANVRIDGRARMDVRSFTLDTGFLENSYGSARVLLGGTEVIVAVGAELGETLQGNAGRLEVSVTSTPGASGSLRKGAHMHNRVQESYNKLLAHSLRELLGGVEPSAHHDASGLEIPITMSSTASTKPAPTVKARCAGIDYSSLFIRDDRCWVIGVHINVLSNGGNIMTAASLACRAALVTARLPKVTVNPEVEGDDGIDISGNPSDAQEIRGARDNVPLCVTLAKLGQSIVADPSLPEEACPLALFHIGVTPALSISSIITKGGAGTEGDSLGATATLNDIPQILSAAAGLGRQMFDAVEEQLAKQAEE